MEQPGRPHTSPVDDGDPVPVFGPVSVPDACVAVLTEAHAVLPDVRSPLDAELWASDIIAALGGGAGGLAALVSAAESDGTAAAMAALRALGSVMSGQHAADAAAAAGRLAARGIAEPVWAAVAGRPDAGECWVYGDQCGRQEVVTASFSYRQSRHVVSVLVDHGQGGGVRDVWIGTSEEDVIDRTRQLSAAEPGVQFELVSARQAGARLQRAVAAGECPRDPGSSGTVASRWALLRARASLLMAAAEPMTADRARRLLIEPQKRS